SAVITISKDWVSYQGANAKYFSPRVLLFITYGNQTSGLLYFEQDSVPLITLDFLSGKSATVNHAMDLSSPIPHFKLPNLHDSNFTQTSTNVVPIAAGHGDSTPASLPIIGPLLSAFASMLSWVISPPPM